jgi:hypothetical protein
MRGKRQEHGSMTMVQKWLDWAGGKQAINGTILEGIGGTDKARCNTRSVVSTDSGMDTHCSARREQQAGASTWVSAVDADANASRC